MRWLAALAILFATTAGWAQSPPSTDKNVPSCTLELKLEGAVTPGTLDYLTRGFRRASELDCRSIFIHINTPGGNLQTTRDIVELILSSSRPVLCLVGPPGGHAGSAGAIILMACHVAGAEPATNLGAAMPIAGSGANIDEDLRNKIIQDTESWIKSLAAKRGRNAAEAGKLVSEARALDAGEAAKLGLIDTLAEDVPRFLSFAQGREVEVSGAVGGTGASGKTVVQVGALTAFEADLRSDFLQFISDPEIAYLLFMASLGLLFFELTHPGAVVPGVAGGIGLLASLIAFHKLNVYWGGVSLIALGVGLLFAEAFVPSFGALGIGGIIALGAGSLLLYDPSSTGGTLPLSLVFSTTAVLGAAMLALAVLAFRTRRMGRARNETALLGKVAVVASFEKPSLRRGMVIVNGEYWRFRSDRDLAEGDRVVVESQDGLTVFVKPLPENYWSRAPKE